MTSLTATATNQQSLNHYYATSSLTESIFKTLDDMEFDLESILVKEFTPGLPTDILAVF